MSTPGEHLLGRKPPQDDEHIQRYQLAPARAVSNVEVEIRRPTLNRYDQGQTPRCVGYSISKIVNYYNGYAFDADWLYAECKKIDGWPNEDGTSGRYACDVLRKQGHWRTINGKPVKGGPSAKHGILSNRWATSVDAIREQLATRQPVALGIDWYDAWFAPKAITSHNAGSVTYTEYWAQPIASAGRIAGGHEIGVWACSDLRQAFGLSNTWGSGWPPLVWIAYTDVDQLLRQGGDACVFTDLPTR